MTSNDKPKDESESRASTSSRARQPARQAPHVVESRPRRYMVAALPQSNLTAMGVQAPALDVDGLYALLEGDPEVSVLRRLPGHDGPPGPFPAIVVADMTAEHALALRRRYPQLHIERDRLLTYTEVPVAPRRRRAAAVVAPGVHSTFTFLVRDGDGKPVPGATVFVAGHGWPAQAVTGSDGRATVSVAGETPESIVSVVVKPRSGHWSAHIDRPSLSTVKDNLIELRRLSETFGGFPDRQVFGWGQLAMNLDRLPPTFRGAGVKVAVIDSGAAIDHPDLLNRISDGIDLTARKPDGWVVDTACHGSHCAAIIAGADDGRGVVGFAVEAEVHACKIFPGGRYSDLIEALDYCIRQRIDVVNLSLGGRHPSQLVAAKIEQARNAGVACVVAAGNDGGPVGFPGTLPTVLTVAAIGKIDAFPAGTAHEAEIQGPRTGEGYFSPRFTCHGPEVDVCAPGVAVLSAVPPDGYAAWDGTSMAAPHVAGLAALVLAHHGDFRERYGQRDARRVERLFQIIKSSCVPLDLGDPRRTGAGLPNALIALGPALARLTPDAGAADVRAQLNLLAAEMSWAGLVVPSAPGPAGVMGPLNPGLVGPAPRVPGGMGPAGPGVGPGPAAGPRFADGAPVAGGVVGMHGGAYPGPLAGPAAPGGSGGPVPGPGMPPGGGGQGVPSSPGSAGGPTGAGPGGAGGVGIPGGGGVLPPGMTPPQGAGEGGTAVPGAECGSGGGRRPVTGKGRTAKARTAASAGSAGEPGFANGTLSVAGPAVLNGPVAGWHPISGPGVVAEGGPVAASGPLGLRPGAQLPHPGSGPMHPPYPGRAEFTGPGPFPGPAQGPGRFPATPMPGGGLTALAWLAEEMRAAGLLTEKAPDPLD